MITNDVRDVFNNETIDKDLYGVDETFRPFAEVETKKMASWFHNCNKVLLNHLMIVATMKFRFMYKTKEGISRFRA